MKKVIIVSAAQIMPNDIILINNEECYVIDIKLNQDLILVQSIDGNKISKLNLSEKVSKVIEVQRGFEPVSLFKAKYIDELKPGDRYYIAPTRKTAESAGYDFYTPINIQIEHKEIICISTNVKAFMQQDEELRLSLRSGLALKGLELMNGIGIIDSDYYNNNENDGNIGFIIRNVFKAPYVFRAGDRIGQGVFSKYLITWDDNADGVRTGGFGSTGR